MGFRSKHHTPGEAVTSQEKRVDGHPHLPHPGVVCQAWAPPGTQRPTALLPSGLKREGSPHLFWCRPRAIELVISQLQLDLLMPLVIYMTLPAWLGAEVRMGRGYQAIKVYRMLQRCSGTSPLKV